MIYIKSKNLKVVLVEFNISGTSHIIQLERGDLDHGIRLAEQIVVWFYDTFYNNFEIENDFTKHLKESWYLYSE